MSKIPQNPYCVVGKEEIMGEKAQKPIVCIKKSKKMEKDMKCSQNDLEISKKWLRHFKKNRQKT